MERDDRQPTTYELEQLLNENFQQKEKIRHQENEIVRMIQELTQLQNEQSELKANIERKSEKIGQLTYGLEKLEDKNSQLEDKNSQLEQKIQQKENEIAQLKQDLHISRSLTSKILETNSYLKEKNDELVEEKKRIECNQNCVSHAVLWICHNKVVSDRVDVQLCRNQIENIIINYAGNTIEKKNLKCGQLMEILKKCEIVAVAAEYKYSSAKTPEINRAWNRLMTTDGNERVVILGRVISTVNDQGHAEVCDLNTRFDGRVTIQNPQNKEWRRVNQDDFRKHVFDDEGLVLFSVNLEKLKQIMEERQDILHITNRVEQTLNMPCPQAQ